MGFVGVHQVNCPIWGWNNSGTSCQISIWHVKRASKYYFSAKYRRFYCSAPTYQSSYFQHKGQTYCTSCKIFIIGSEERETGYVNTEYDGTEVVQIDKDIGKYNKAIHRLIKRIFSKYWNINWPSWYGGYILGNECQKLMSLARLICDKIQELLFEGLEESGGSARANRKVNKRCDIIAEYSLLFDRLLYLLRTPHKYLTPWKIQKA